MPEPWVHPQDPNPKWTWDLCQGLRDCPLYALLGFDCVLFSLHSRIINPVRMVAPFSNVLKSSRLEGKHEMVNFLYFLLKVILK